MTPLLPPVAAREPPDSDSPEPTEISSMAPVPAVVRPSILDVDCVRFEVVTGPLDTLEFNWAWVVAKAPPKSATPARAKMGKPRRTKRNRPAFLLMARTACPPPGRGRFLRRGFVRPAKGTRPDPGLCTR